MVAAVVNGWCVVEERMRKKNSFGLLNIIFFCLKKIPFTRWFWVHYTYHVMSAKSIKMTVESYLPEVSKMNISYFEVSKWNFVPNLGGYGWVWPFLVDQFSSSSDWTTIMLCNAFHGVSASLMPLYFNFHLCGSQKCWEIIHIQQVDTTFIAYPEFCGIAT